MVSTAERTRPVGSAATSYRPIVFMIAGISALGGLLFGYDTGIISSALLFISSDFHLSSFMQEVVTSTILVGAVIGALLSGMLSERFGRRRLVGAAALIFAVGAIGAALAPDVPALIAARFVLGLAVGGAAGMVPVYIAELAPVRIRGGLMVFFQLMVAVGELISYLTGYGFAHSGGWRIMFAIAVAPAVALFIGMLFLPESPRWLMKRSDEAGARAVLQRVSDRPEEVEQELEEIRSVQAGESASWRVLTQRWARPALVVGFGIAAFSQLTGINAMVYYAPTILKSAGFKSQTAILTGVGVGVLLVVGAVAGTLLVDRIGRRRLLLGLLPLSAVAMAVLALAFRGGELSGGARWVVVGALLAYIGLNGASIQVVVWLIGPEVFPLKVRGPAMSLASVTVWAFNLAISLITLSLINAIGATATFLLFAAMTVACWLFVWRLVPETRGRSLEQIERALAMPGSFRDAVHAQPVAHDAERAAGTESTPYPSEHESNSRGGSARLTEGGPR